MSTDIYYYSGTGNSLRVAQELQKRIPEARLISVVHSLRNGTVKTSAEKVGFVFPNFCLTIPIPLHDFLEKADLTSAQYIFAICTRGGSQSEAFVYMNEMLRQHNRRLNAQIDMNMPWNHPVGKENLAGLNTQERIAQQEIAMQSKLDMFSEAVAANKEYIPADTGADHELSFGMKLFDLLISKSLNYKSHEYMYQNLVRFYADNKCKGCGICQTVCLSERIEIIDNKPAWKRDTKCYACFACINYCPQRAIQVQSRFPIQSYTEVNDRYHHQSVTHKDIAKQR